MATELLVLGGERTEAADGGTFSVTEPGTGGAMGRSAAAGRCGGGSCAADSSPPGAMFSGSLGAALAARTLGL